MGMKLPTTSGTVVADPDPWAKGVNRHRPVEGADFTFDGR